MPPVSTVNLTATQVTGRGAQASAAASVLTPSSSTAAAHGAFLELARRSMAMQSEALLAQQRLLERLVAGTFAPASLAPPNHAPPSDAPAFDRAMCLEFASGSLEAVLGPRFAAVDRHRTRVRLPAPPLMLCDRILTVEGELGVPGPGRCVTEHDVLEGAWYLDAGRAPVCISVEAGQADLFLSAYLGIDFETKGERVYRLLDARIVFHRDLPRVGETIRYDIRIDRFICQGDTWLFFFRFDGTIDGAPFITMYDGCAGFFSEEQLASGRGIVDEPPAPLLPRRVTADGVETAPFTPLVPPCRAAFGEAALEALRRGDLGAAFEGAFEGLTLAPTLRLPSGRMRLVDRIALLDTQGGARGLGFVHGEADVTPDAWYLTCHFDGDPVMPGTLMYECCLHTLRVLLLRMGLVAEGDGAELHHAPVEGVASRLRCRGQVLETTKTVAYKVEITEIGYDPEPYVIANASMFSDGRHVVEMQGMSTRIRGLSRAKVEALWAAAPANRATTFTREQILAYAEGNPSSCFGEPYRVFDADRRLARLPRPPFLFVDRVVSCAPPPWKIAPGGWVECELDVPEAAWYFGENRQGVMPFAVLLEAGLQPCGWLAAYVGSALSSDEDLHFRNLDGTATVFEEVSPDAGTLLLRTRLTKASDAGGMLLQEFDMEVFQGGRKVYAGHTGFGFFPARALAAQVGLRGATLAALPSGARSFELPREPLSRPKDGHPVSPVSGLELPTGALLMVDRIDALELDGGPKGLGFIAGRKTVNPSEWFFDAHFYQDPVMPGSLGLEALVQLLKVFARERFGGLARTHRAESMAIGRPHRWQYRGQVIPTNREVTLQVNVTEIALGHEPLLVADGLLAVDGRVIYALKDMSLRLVPMAPPAPHARHADGSSA
jgi:3-hydroxymyristoyl/3-hydroxydecanoyl-(acyl carrier protein) dehydratase